MMLIRRVLFGLALIWPVSLCHGQRQFVLVKPFIPPGSGFPLIQGPAPKPNYRDFSSPSYDYYDYQYDGIDRRTGVGGTHVIRYGPPEEGEREQTTQYDLKDLIQTIALQQGDPRSSSILYNANCGAPPPFQSLAAYSFTMNIDSTSITTFQADSNGFVRLGGVEPINTGSGSPQFPNVTVMLVGTGQNPDGTPASFRITVDDTKITNMQVGNNSCSPTPTGSTGLSTGTQALAGEPISTATGEFIVEPAVDLFLGGPLPLFLRRSHSSFLVENSNVGIIGVNWITNFDPYVRGDGKNFIVIMENGRVSFVANGNTFQTAFPQRLPYQLVRSGSGGYRFYDAGKDLIYDFNSNGFLIAIEDRNGNTLTVTEGIAGPTQVSDGLGRILNFSYGAGNKVSKVTDQSGRFVSYGQNSANLTSVTDANGNTTSYAYNSFREVTQITRPRANVPVAQTYDPFFRVATQIDSGGNKTTMSYVSGGTPGLTKVTDPLGHTSTYNYPNLTDLSSFTDAAGQTASYAYDTRSRPTSFTDRLGNKTAVTYDAASGYPASITDAQGNTTTYTYQSQVQGDFTFFNLTKITYADGTSASFTYDANGNVLKAANRAGKTTTYTYNSRGQVLTATNPAGGVTTYTYNTDATLATVKLPSGDVTTYSYDSLKRLAKVQNADNTSVAFTRDALDHILSITDERGKVTKFGYDVNNNFQSTTDALNQTAKLTYDSDDLPSTASDRLGNTSKVQYDPLGSVTAITNAAGEKTTLAYDNLERVKSLADPNGKGPSFTYDAEGRPATVADALGNTTSIAVNKNGLPTQFTSPLAENTAITYDAMNRVIGIQDALARQSSFAYEGRGLPTAINAPGGLTASFAWGDLPLLNSVTDPNGGVWSFTRDNLGRVTATTDPLGQMRSYKYDARSRITSASTSLDSGQVTYDQAGNVTQVQYSDNTALSYTYDDDNRLTGGTGFTLGYDADGRLASSNGLTITRDAVGRISAITYAPGKTLKYAYDSRGLVSGVSDWANGSVNFTLNDAHQLVSAARSNGVTTQYTYDKDGQLASIADINGGKPLASIQVTRDAIGRVTAANRTIPQEASPPGASATLSYDGASQVSGASYDARGRLTNDNAGATYQWTVNSRLLSYKRPDGSASFSYDGLGQRVSRTGADGTTLKYVLNYATGLPSVAIVQSGGSDLRYYVYSPGGALLYSVDTASGAHRFYSFDDTGSTTLLTDDSGAITDAYGVSSYGDTVTPGSSNSTDNPFTWQGQLGVMQEPASGLYYARFRYYDAATARFISRDPLLSPAPREINPYQYAAGNPVANDDPAGLTKQPNFTPLSSLGYDPAFWSTILAAQTLHPFDLAAGRAPTADPLKATQELAADLDMHFPSISRDQPITITDEIRRAGPSSIFTRTARVRDPHNTPDLSFLAFLNAQLHDEDPLLDFFTLIASHP